MGTWDHHDHIQIKCNKTRIYIMSRKCRSDDLYNSKNVKLTFIFIWRSLEGQVYALLVTTIRLRFDGRSTTYQRSLWSQLHNPLATVTLSYYLGCSAAAHTGRPAIVS